MRSVNKIERWVKAASFRADPEMDKALWTEIAMVYDRPAVGSSRKSPLRAVLASTPVRLAAVIILLVALVLWQPFGSSGKAYALSDAIATINQARTIHIRTTLLQGKPYEKIYEYWYDLEQGNEYTYHESTYPRWADSPDPYGKPVELEPYTKAVTTVWDGQYLMRTDHEKRTVRFERLLPWEQELRRRRMADHAMNAALPDVLQHLRYYTKVGKDMIDGQSYDIWRREWRIPMKSRDEARVREDIWVSPSSGEIGRTRRWDHMAETGWLLMSETDKIAVDQEPPSGIFATEPPAGYTLENTKATADILRRDFLLHRTRQGSELSALPCLMLEDGSIVAIWTVVGGQTQVDPNKVYAGLTLGGPVPQPPLSVPGLLYVPGAESYGWFHFRDEKAPAAMIPAVGRHLICTSKGDRTYAWALYVPPNAIPSRRLKNHSIVAVVRSEERDLPAIFGTFLEGIPVTREQFAQYLSEAFPELSDDPAVPAFMNYENFLRLARTVRGNKRLYRDFTEQARSIMDQTPAEAVEIVSPDGIR